MKRSIACVLAFTFVLGLAAVDASAAPVRYTAGHADIGLGEEDRLWLHLHAAQNTVIDGSPLPFPGAEFEPDEVIVIVPYASQEARPDGTQWDPIGVASTTPFWILPQSSTPGVPYLGLGTEEMDDGVFDGDSLELRLIAMTGPGVFSTWENTMFGPDFFMSTYDGIDGNDKVAPILIPVHRHVNFGFSQPGTYLVTFEAYGTIGGVAHTDTGTFTFEVVPEPAVVGLLAAAGLTGLALAARRRRKTSRVVA
jgi:surface-anchored protein